MADNRTMAQMLQAPIEGYEDAIVVPPINANNFELKQPLINLVQSNKFTEGYDLLLWGDLKTLIEPNEEDEIWRNQQDWNLINWKLHNFCGVHVLLMDTGLVIHMMVEKKYPLSQDTLSKMLSRRLEVDHQSEMGYELIRGGLLGINLQLLVQELSTAQHITTSTNCKEWNSYLVVLADGAESVRDAIGFEYCLASSSGWTKDWESSLTGLELVQETTNKVMLIKEKLKAARDCQKSYVGNMQYLADTNLHVHLEEIKVDKTLRFAEEPVEIIDREVKSLKRSRIPIVKSIGTRSEFGYQSMERDRLIVIEFMVVMGISFWSHFSDNENDACVDIVWKLLVLQNCDTKSGRSPAEYPAGLVEGEYRDDKNDVRKSGLERPLACCGLVFF
ncbi:hypothetical protein Tco_0620302 [Tanacetum coccineum]